MSNNNTQHKNVTSLAIAYRIYKSSANRCIVVGGIFVA